MKKACSIKILNKGRIIMKITNDFKNSALRRGILVRPKDNKGNANKAIMTATAIELANLGFIVNPIELEGMTSKDLASIVDEARAIMGTDRDMVPVYPGFPQQVEALSTMTLLIEQILHYWSFGLLIPDYPAIARKGLPIEDMLKNARELKVMNATDAAQNIVETLVGNPISMSEEDTNLMEGALEFYKPTIAEIATLVNSSRNAENVQSFVMLVNKTSTLSTNDLLKVVVPASNSLDKLLRVVLGLKTVVAEEKWEGNYLLAVKHLSDNNSRSVRMKSMPRSIRRVIVLNLGYLTKGFYADGLVSCKNLWRKVMTSVHPYDFNLSEDEKRAVDIIHSNIEYKTLNSLIETAMINRDVVTASWLLAKNQPGNLLRRAVALLRLVDNSEEAEILADSIRESSGKAALTTLISAYNGIIVANDTNARVTRVAGLKNTMLEREVTAVEEGFVTMVALAVKDAIVKNLSGKTAPVSNVGVVSTDPVPLVRRDASNTDRYIERGEKITPVGEGEILRMFGHFNNNQLGSGYMDIGAVILNGDMKSLSLCTWDTANEDEVRAWSTYSGDKLVSPGDSAAEYVDVKLDKVAEIYPEAKYIAMTVQSWSGWPINDVDFLAGTMLRSDGESGEVFDARTVATAFKPTTESTQSIPLVVDLNTGEMIWIDSSNGSTGSGVSSSHDDTIGPIVYDELKRPRLTLGELAELYATAHNATMVSEPVNKSELMKLL